MWNSGRWEYVSLSFEAEERCNKVEKRGGGKRNCKQAKKYAKVKYKTSTFVTN